MTHKPDTNPAIQGDELFPETFEQAYAIAKAKSLQFMQNFGDMTDPQIRVIDATITAELRLQFAHKSPSHFTQIWEADNIEDRIIREQITRAHPPAALGSMEKYISYRHSDQMRRDIISDILKSHPELEKFTRQDAFALVGPEANFVEARKKFPNVDKDILVVLSHTMMELEYGKLIEYHREALKALTSAQEDSAYIQWERSKRIELLKLIMADSALVANIKAVKSPFNIHTLEDAMNQLILKERIADSLGKHFAQVYGLAHLDTDDIHVVYQPMKTIEKDNFNAYLSYLKTGLDNDETIIIRENPAYALITGKDLYKTDAEAAKAFVYRAIEELQHATDSIHADRLAQGRLTPPHPAYRHTVLTMLNSINFDGSQDYYSTQFLERTAKQVASALSQEIMQNIDAPPKTGGKPLKTEPSATLKF